MSNPLGEGLGQKPGFLKSAKHFSMLGLREMIMSQCGREREKESVSVCQSTHIPLVSSSLAFRNKKLVCF